MLDGVGVSAAAERVYRALLRHPASSPAQLAALAEVSPAELNGVMDQLVQADLVREVEDDAGTRHPGLATPSVRWRPREPKAALAALVRQRQQSLDRVLNRAEELATEFAEGMLRSRRSPLAEVIDGEQSVVAALIDLTATARKDVAVLDAPPYLSVAASAAAERSLMSRGVRSRAVYARTALELPGRYEAIRAMVADGEQARLLPQVPLKLLLVDGERALLPLSIDGGRIGSAILVHPSMLASALHALFDALWSQAQPFPVDTSAVPADALDEADRQLLLLLGTGMKDEAIARQLGISARTLGRRVTRLLGRLGAGSRFQAGMEAQRRGWL